jgi:metallo-beta-lactamase family protein
MLGAASIDLHVGSSGTDTGRHIVFSGDLGRQAHPLLVAPAPLGSPDVLVSESTYGDRVHPHVDLEDVFAEVVNEAARSGGVVLIPAFAVDRTEIVVWHLDRLVASGRIPDLLTFVDSPMTLSALSVYREREEAKRGSPDVRPEFQGVELLPSLQLREAPSVEQSKEISALQGPMIIISASGMATGGRVLHHLAQRMGDDATQSCSSDSRRPEHAATSCARAPA